jgi:NodT family efflux transporter outer membrane factor (OMF) lipoprotein
MKSPSSPLLPVMRLRAVACCAMMIGLLGLTGCASFDGIQGAQHLNQPDNYATQRSLAQGAGNGQWPDSNWVEQFGDPQLNALIAEALANNPTLAQAKARLDQASALAESKGAPLLPTVNAEAGLTRNLFPATTIYPAPYGGSWYNEKSAFLQLNYELDLWGKNHAALEQAVSQAKAAAANAQETRLVLTTSIASAYNQLATQYALHTLLERTLAQRESLQKLTAQRVHSGLDTQIERSQSQGSVADARAQLLQSEGQITVTRQQIGTLLGKGPDRGLQINAPHLNLLATPLLPAQLPLNLLGRRPDIVAARWQVEAANKDIDTSKARFYPDINLSASAGFDSLLNTNPFTAASKSISFGPAISLPIFEGGALRANLKGAYAAYDLAVATYNQTLNQAFGEVAQQLTGIRSIDQQLPIRRDALASTQRAYDLAKERYRIGLTTQLTVLNAETALLNEQQQLINLEASRRNQQIGLFKALGGGFDAEQMGLAIADQKTQAAQPH